ARRPELAHHGELRDRDGGRDAAPRGTGARARARRPAALRRGRALRGSLARAPAHRGNRGARLQAGRLQAASERRAARGTTLALGGTMLVEHEGKRPVVAESAYVAPTPVVSGEVTIGERSRILFGAVLTADG